MKWSFFCRGVADDALAADRSALGACQRTAKMARLEAVLFVVDAPVSPRRLAQLATLADHAEALELIDQLNASYDRAGCAFRVERVATGFRLLTRPEFVFWLDKLHHRQSQLKLSPPALETLAIVAYRQPITRADIEAIRGVQCTEMLKQLMERSLVKIAGEDDSLGRPYLYGTTTKFLELFGLHGVDDLPAAAELRRPENSTPARTGDAPTEAADAAGRDDRPHRKAG